MESILRKRNRIPKAISLNPLAYWMARQTWGAILWWMRRPFIKRLRRNTPNLLPEHMRKRAWENMKAHDAWAMKHGVTLLTVAINIFMMSVVFTYAYVGVSKLAERTDTSGYFRIDR